MIIIVWFQPLSSNNPSNNPILQNNQEHGNYLHSSYCSVSQSNVAAKVSIPHHNHTEIDDDIINNFMEGLNGDNLTKKISHAQS